VEGRSEKERERRKESGGDSEKYYIVEGWSFLERMYRSTYFYIVLTMEKEAGYADPRTGLNDVVITKILPVPVLELQPLAVQLTKSRYTGCSVG
jgi:hypothetical protein